MTAGRLNKWWALIAVFLLVVNVIGGIIAWSRYNPSRAVEIYIPPGQEMPGRIYIGGNVTAPGFYPFTTSDSIEALIQVAGGITSSELCLGGWYLFGLGLLGVKI